MREDELEVRSDNLPLPLCVYDWLRYSPIDEKIQREMSRNTKLNALSYKMGRLMVRGWIGQEEVERWLLMACEKNGLLEDDGMEQCRATLTSGLNAGALRPYHDLRAED